MSKANPLNTPNVRWHATHKKWLVTYQHPTEGLRYQYFDTRQQAQEFFDTVTKKRSEELKRKLLTKLKPIHHRASLMSNDHVLIAVDIKQDGPLLTEANILFRDGDGYMTIFSETDDTEIRNFVEAFRRLSDMLTSLVERTED